jgi:hypothetical protein
VANWTHTSYTNLKWGADRAVDKAGTAEMYPASGIVICGQTTMARNDEEIMLIFAEAI